MKAVRRIAFAWLIALGMSALESTPTLRAADGWHSAGQSESNDDGRSILRSSSSAGRASAGRLPAVSRVPVTAPEASPGRPTATKVAATTPVNRRRSDPPPEIEERRPYREGLDPVDDVFADVFEDGAAAQQSAPQSDYQRSHQSAAAQRGSRVQAAAYQTAPRTMPPSAFGPGGPANRPREVLPTPQPSPRYAPQPSPGYAPQPAPGYAPQPTPADGSGMEWLEGSPAGPYAEGYVDPSMGCSSCGDGFYDDGYCGECGQCGDCCQDCGPYACPSCDMCHDCYGGFLQYTTLFAGPQAFKGPLDLGKNGNFGFHAGANFGAPIWFAKNIGGQIGAQWVGSDFSGTGVPYDSSGNLIPGGYNTTSRNQLFLTAGLFHRATFRNPWQFGAAWDYLDDRYYTSTSWSKVRGEISFVGSAGDEIGAWASVAVTNITVPASQSLPTVNNQPLQFQASDLYAFFYRKYFPRGATARAWAGFTNGSDGMVGGDIRMPLSDWFALEANLNYIIPKSNTAEGPYNRESWAIMCNLVFYPGLNARCMTWSPWRPLFGVADNSTFILRRQ
ncbi:MAG: hypothetical protein K2Y37_08250 [Pirellulales bacterium]|nr:hypothetical protein [Pirellulales bacterium]